MGMYSDWKDRNSETNSEKQVVNVEFVLKSIDVLIDLIYPVGCYYTQYAGSGNTFVDEEKPQNLFGKTWTLMFDTDGVFFKTERYDGAIARSAGIQTDAIRNITGSIAALRLGYGADGYIESSGAFYGSNSGKTRPLGESDRNDVLKIQFDASRTVPTDTYNHPRNRLIRVWKRTG